MVIINPSKCLIENFWKIDKLLSVFPGRILSFFSERKELLFKQLKNRLKVVLIIKPLGDGLVLTVSYEDQ
jgi:formylmethanofuran:tetrahydromethanopterin formyltransferase